MNKLIAISLGLVFLIACTGQNRENKGIDIKGYYFPYNKFTTQKTYCYVNMNDTLEKSYWMMQTKIEGKDTSFCTTILNAKKQKSEDLNEKVSDHGTNIQKYNLFKPEDNRLAAECKIIESSVFNWIMNQGESIAWKVEFEQFDSKQKIMMTKDRTFINLDTTKNIAYFIDKMSMVIEGTGQKIEYQVETQYKKNIGLINYKIILTNGKIKVFNLIEE